jgi:hypothetical protein
MSGGCFEVDCVKAQHIMMGDHWKIEVATNNNLIFSYDGTEQMTVIPENLPSGNTSSHTHRVAEIEELEGNVEGNVE